LKIGRGEHKGGVVLGKWTGALELETHEKKKKMKPRRKRLSCQTGKLGKVKSERISKFCSQK